MAKKIRNLTEKRRRGQQRSVKGGGISQSVRSLTRLMRLSTRRYKNAITRTPSAMRSGFNTKGLRPKEGSKNRRLRLKSKADFTRNK